MLEKLVNTPNRWKLFWFLFLVPVAILILALLTSMLLDSLEPSKPVKRISSTRLGWKNKQNAVFLKFAVEGKTGKKPPIDVVICLDHSGSMGSSKEHESNLSKAKRSAGEFAQILAGADTRLSLITFDEKSELLCELSDDNINFLNALDKIKDGGGTNIAGAIREAASQFLIMPRESAQKYIIVISDGQDDISRTRSIIETANEQTITVIGIGVGYSAQPTFFDDAFGYPNFSYCCFPDADALYDLFLRMIQKYEILETAGKGATITEHYNNKHFKLPDKERSTYSLSISNPTDGILQWQMPYLFSSEFSISYNIAPRHIGIHKIAASSATLTYSNNSGQLVGLSSNQAPRILVISPWLLFYLWLPAFLYLLLILTSKRKALELKNTKDIHLISPKASELTPIPLVEKLKIKVYPTVILFVGGQGLEVAAHFKQLLKDIMPMDTLANYFLLAVDIDRRKNIIPSFCGSSISEDELLLIAQNEDFSFVIDKIAKSPQNYPEYHKCIDFSDLKRADKSQLNIHDGTKGLRHLARLVFFEDLINDNPQIESKFQELQEWTKNKNCVQLLVVGSSTGGTSSGILVDTAYQIRKQILKQLNSFSTIPTYLFLTSKGKEAVKNRGNYISFMTELNRIQSIGESFTLLPTKGENNNLSFEKVDLPFFDKITEYKSSDQPSLVADSLLLFSEDNQRNALFNLLRDTEFIRQEREKREQNAGMINLSINSILFPLNRLHEKLALLTISSVLNQIVGFDKKENDLVCFKGKNDLNEILKNWEIIDAYSSITDENVIQILKNWQNFLINDSKQGEVESLVLQVSDIQLYKCYSSILTIWLNGVQSLYEHNAEGYINSRRGNLFAATQLFKTFENKCRELKDQNQYSNTINRNLEIFTDIYRKLAKNLDDWINSLVQNTNEFQRNDSSIEKGLARYSNDRMITLRSQENLLSSIDNRYYLFDEGNDTTKLDYLWKKHISTKLVQNGELCRLFRWEVDDNQRIYLHLNMDKDFRYNTKSMLADFIDHFQTYLFTSLVPSLTYLNLSNKLEGAKEPDAIKILTSNDQFGDYVLFTFPNLKEWPNFEQIKSQIENQIFSPKILKLAPINNPYMLSLVFIKPHVMLNESELLRAADTDNPPQFIQPPEKFAFRMKREIENRTGMVSSFPCPMVRSIVLLENNYEKLVYLLANGNLFEETKKKMFKTWCFKDENELFPIDLWSSSSRLEAFLRLTILQTDRDGRQIRIDKALEKWQALSKQKQIDKLESLQNVLENDPCRSVSATENEVTTILRIIVEKEISKLR